MRRLFLTVPLSLFAASSFAAGWESGLQEDEGGPVMMAWVYAAEGGDGAADLVMYCFDQMILRYGQGVLPQGAPDPVVEQPVSFAFRFGDDTVTLDMQLEEMDGKYAAYVPTDAPIIGYLRSAASVTVGATDGLWPAQEFTLQGSSKAIAAVLGTCT